MILKNVLKSASGRLRGKKIKDVRIGLGLMAVELDDGSIGVTYVLRDDIGDCCTAFSRGGNLIGTPATRVARWAVEGKDVLSVAMGMAVMNSAADFGRLERIDARGEADAVFSVGVRPSETVGVIGHIGPVIAGLKGRVKKIYVFERGEDVPPGIRPESDEPKLLPKCKVVFISSTSLINDTLESRVLGHCTGARDIVMVGTSTPLYPDAFAGSGVTVLAGTRWLPAHGKEILEGVSQGAGIRELIEYGEKISVRVER